MATLKNARLDQFKQEVIPNHDLHTKFDNLNNREKAERKIYDTAKLVISKGGKDKHGTPTPKVEKALCDLHTARDSILRAIIEE